MRGAIAGQAERIIIVTSNQEAMSSRRNYLVLLAPLACLLLASCGKQPATVSELASLQRDIVRMYGENGVNVNLSEEVSLTVTFINSPLNSKTQDDRARRAQETAVFVKQHYPSIQKLEEIWVVFLRQETRFVVITTSYWMDYFGFDKGARPLPMPNEDPSEAGSDGALKPTAVYSPSLNETDISINRLQLEGDMSQGVAVAPHFVISGDVTGVRLSGVAPKSVSFDFASYSEKSMFPGKIEIVFLADGKVVYQKQDTFSTSKSADGGYSEFLLVQVPYEAFRRMIAGTTLTIRLGDREFLLNKGQLNALRSMIDYVKAETKR
jgi:hypothetical protein